jgi:ATP-dependent helicase HrpA
MPEITPILPITQRRAEIVDAIARHQVVIVAGQTGSGKTTQLPQFCLEMGRDRAGLIGHTQPRRLAARAVAARIAEERGVRLGGLVGAKVRFQDQTSRETVIKVLTDGMLLAELAADPLLRAYGTLIVDEAHERSLNIDFLLGYLRRLLPKRPDLKLIITSATIDTERFSAAFGGPAVAPVIEVSGRMFPVEMRYGPARDDEDGAEVDFEAVADAVEDLSRPSLPRGDVLVFLPGEREIRLADNAVRRRALDSEILPLFSRLTNQEQDRIFHPGDRRRVILATNVAETSLTVPGIRYVVDTGLARQSRYDPARKVQGLPIEPISQASANQRSGRCGRVADGICIRLYSEASFKSRPAFTDPEIRRTSLASVILRMKSLDLGPVEQFPFLDPPDAAAIRDGYETLFELGAIAEPTSAAPLTPNGESMGRIPLDPRIARMLLAADREGSLDAVLILAAALEIQDPRQRPMGRQEESDRAQAVFRHPSSDFLTLLKIHDQYHHATDTMSSGQVVPWCHQHFLSPPRMREWGEMIRQLRHVAEEIGLQPSPRPPSDEAIHRALLTGLITNVACREGDGSFDYRGVRGNSVQIFPGSALFKTGPKWIMAAEVVQTTRLYARTVAKVDPAWIEELAGHMFRRQLSDHHLDAETGEPSAWERVTMSGIVVVPRRRTSIVKSDPKAARELFIRDGLVRGKWPGAAELPFARHNGEVLETARRAEAKLRRRNIIAGEDTLTEWFAARIPIHVCDPASFEAWYRPALTENPSILQLHAADVLLPEGRAAADPAAFPDSLTLGPPTSSVTCPLDYALAPGKDEDGVTITIPLTSLPLLTPERAAWLVPGMLPELVQALVKTLPKPARATLEAQGPPAQLGAELADVLHFAQGPLAAALSEAADVLHGVKIDPAAWTSTALPSHLRLRIRVVDDHSKEIAVDRDAAKLHERLSTRIRRAQAAQARARFQRDGLTTWDFGDLPDEIPADGGGNATPTFPALIDNTTSVSLTLLDSSCQATLHTTLGIRRLFALACREELDHHLASLPQWSDIARQFAQLGTTEELRTDLACLIAERVFMAGQPPVRTQAEFEQRKADCWGRIATATREVADIIARTLEPRSRIAHRFSGGTPRLWASSVADIREHAAYLMPRGFLLHAPWERLRHYPRYVECMRNRLFALREEGSGVETVALAKVAPHWKKFTGWVAAAMSAERAAAEALAESPVPSTHRDPKAPLPKARRAAPVVNLDAGEWAMQPGHLPPALEQFRWALEEYRAGLFAPDPTATAKPSVTPGDLDALWKKVQAESGTPPAR